jgi:hypothetical protein
MLAAGLGSVLPAVEDGVRGFRKGARVKQAVAYGKRGRIRLQHPKIFGRRDADYLHISRAVARGASWRAAPDDDEHHVYAVAL